MMKELFRCNETSECVWYDDHGGWAPGAVLEITAMDRQSARQIAIICMHGAGEDSTLHVYCMAAINAIDNIGTELIVNIDECKCGCKVMVQHPDHDKYLFVRSSDKPGILISDFEQIVEKLEKIYK